MHILTKDKIAGFIENLATMAQDLPISRALVMKLVIGSKHTAITSVCYILFAKKNDKLLVFLYPFLIKNIYLKTILWKNYPDKGHFCTEMLLERIYSIIKGFAKKTRPRVENAEIHSETSELKLEREIYPAKDQSDCYFITFKQPLKHQGRF